MPQKRKAYGLHQRLGSRAIQLVHTKEAALRARLVVDPGTLTAYRSRKGLGELAGIRNAESSKCPRPRPIAIFLG
jgi:hypothetical protein